MKINWAAHKKFSAYVLAFVLAIYAIQNAMENSAAAKKYVPPTFKSAEFYR